MPDRRLWKNLTDLLTEHGENKCNSEPQGGVAKTTSCVNIAAALAKMGRRILLVDVDPQANLTSSFTDESKIEASIYDAMKGDPAPIMNIGDNLDLIPSHIDLAGADMVFSNKIAQEQILRNILDEIKENYDYIIIDTPPALGLVTINALTAAQSVILSICAETLPLRGLVMLDEMISDIARSINRGLHVSGIIIAKYNRRKLDKAVIDAIREKYGDKIFKTYVRTCVAAAETPTYRQSVLDYAPDSNAAADYMALAREIDNQTI